LAVGEQPERSVEAGFDLLVGRAESLESGLGMGEFALDAVLFDAQHVDGYGTLVVGLHELELLILQLRQTAFFSLAFLGGTVGVGLEQGEDMLGDRVASGLVERDVLVVVGDGVFHGFDAHGFLGAGGALLPAPAPSSRMAHACIAHIAAATPARAWERRSRSSQRSVPRRGSPAPSTNSTPRVPGAARLSQIRPR